MESIRLASFGSFYVIIFLSTLIEAGPVRPLIHNREQRHIKESSSSISMETLKVIDTCLLDGYSVPRNSIICEKKPPGCRAIQKTNSCCPDYLCDCEKNGKLYGNGEKIIDADNPCRVCYCQGGEITCSPVTCYSRTDCEPKYISGRCCPEFDNCPPLEHQKSPQLNSTLNDNFENLQHNVISLNDNHVLETTTSVITTSDKINVVNENPLGIKIKEITKPEEIRITDENKRKYVNKQINTANKASKDANHTEKFNTTISPSTSESETFISSSEISSIFSSTSTDYPNLLNDSDHTLFEFGDQLETMKTVRHTEQEFNTSESIEEVQFEDGNNKRLNEHENSKLTSIESSSESGDLLSSTTEQTYQSSSPIITEITPSKEKSSPSVVQIGDRLVIVDHSQSHAISVIKVEEAAGLQRGEDDSNYENDSLDNEDLINLSSSTSAPLLQSNELYSDMTMSTTENGLRKSSETVLFSQNENETEEASGVNEEPISNIAYTSGSGDLENNSGGGELNIPTVSSDEIIQIIEDSAATRNLGILTETSTYMPVLTDQKKVMDVYDSSGDKIFETVYYTEGPQTSLESSSVEVVRDTTFWDSTSLELSSSISNEVSTNGPSADLSEELMPVIQKTYIEDDESHVLISPGYGKIPDEFSLHSRSSAIHSEDEMMHLRKDHSQESNEGPEHSDMVEKKISKAMFDLSTTQSPLEHGSEFLLENIQYRSPGEPLLIPEWERNLTTISPLEKTEISTKASNHLAEILQETLNAINHDKSSSEEIDKAFKKDVEPTTLKPTTPTESKVSFNGEFSIEKTDAMAQPSLIPKLYNPKDDAESLKLKSNEPVEGLNSYEHIKNSDSKDNSHWN